jgi:hypothetical protein
MEYLKTYKLFEQSKISEEVLNNLFLKSINTTEELIQMMLDKGSDINYDECECINIAIYNQDLDILEFLLKNKNLKLKKIDTYRKSEYLYDIDLQKLFIDCDYADIIFNSVGFNPELKKDSNYENVIGAYEEGSKLGLF